MRKILFICVFGFLGCAEPKYVQKNLTAGPASGDKEKLSPVSCPIADKFPGQNCELQFSKSKLCVSVKVIECPDSKEKKFGVFHVKFFRQNVLDQSPIPQEIDGEFKMNLWMPSMGHGSSPVTIKKVDVGSYLVERVFFIMNGAWEVHLQVNKGNEIDEVKIDLDL